jgi:hypothetical protein
MLRFLKLGPHDGAQADYIDLASIVYVREANPTGGHDTKGLEVHIHFTGGATTRLTGSAAREFLGQFQAYIDRLHFQTPTFSGPGHSALSP